MEKELEKDSDIVEEYIEYVQEVIDKFGKDMSLIESSSDSITPQSLNSALGRYLETNLVLIAEYQRAKIEHYKVEKAFKRWEDEKFLDIRDQLISESEAKTAKIAVKEIDTKLRHEHGDEYYDWQDKVEGASMRVQFLLRIVDLYKKFDQILTTLANNMRQEMRTLSVENRMNQTGGENKVRRRKLED